MKMLNEIIKRDWCSIYFYYYIQIFYSNDTTNNLKVYWVLHDSLIFLVWVWWSLLKQTFSCVLQTDPQPHRFVHEKCIHSSAPHETLSFECCSSRSRVWEPCRDDCTSAHFTEKTTLLTAEHNYTSVIEFTDFSFVNCCTNLWTVCDVCVRALTEGMSEAWCWRNFSSANGGISQSDRLMQIPNPVHATPDKYVIGCCNYDGTSAPRFRHALRQALTPTSQSARTHTRHTLDVCAHSDHLDMVVYKR